MKQGGSSTTKHYKNGLLLWLLHIFIHIKKNPAAVFRLTPFLHQVLYLSCALYALTHLFTAGQEKTISLFTFYTTGGAGS